MGESNIAQSGTGQRPANESAYRAVVLGVAALLAVGLIRLQFCAAVSLPDKPTKPVIKVDDVQAVALEAEANPITYKGYLESDSKHYRLAEIATPEQMARAFPYKSETPEHEMERGDKGRVEFAGLALTLSLRRVRGSTRKLMVLGIENLSDQYVAYNVQTAPSAGTRICQSKRHFGHNAMVLEPHGKVERTECTYQKGWDLEISAVETLEIPPLALHYVSRVPPKTAGIETRVSRGHSPPEGKPCQIMLSTQMRAQQKSRRVAWRDIIDFYARHRCDTYQLPADYQAFPEDGAQMLPVMPRR